MTASAILSQEKKLGFLYRLTFPNGKSYIGITKRTVKQRFVEHVNFAKSGKSGSAVHYAINKFGSDEVIVETLASAEWASLKLLEVEAIAEQNTRPPFGYNLTKGGDGVAGFDEVTRAKMGAANVGRKPSQETRDKISASGKGRKASDQARKNISIGRTGLVFNTSHRENLSEARKLFIANNPPVRFSDETKARMSAAKTGLSHTDATREKIRALNIGKKLSTETRTKQSKAISAKWANPEWREKNLLARRGKRDEILFLTA